MPFSLCNNWVYYSLLLCKMGLFEFVYGTAKPQLGCCLLDGATWDQSVSQQLNSTVPLRGTRDPPFIIPKGLSSRSLLETMRFLLRTGP